MNTEKCDITVLVASYNPKWSALKKTLCSVLNQKGIKFQIVVADDGSEVTYFEQIRELFAKYNFKEFKLVHLDSNSGTCYNIYNGLLHSEGKYVKLIGAGDCLFSQNTLLNWVSYANEKKADICFGDAVFFSYTSDGKESIVTKRRYPQNLDPYRGENYSVKEAIYNYVLLGDVVWGSNLIVDTEIMAYYLKSILGKIKYAEDMIYRMMISDGRKLVYFPENVIWYEYGTGISTSQNSNWNAIISNERKITNICIEGNNIFKSLERKKFCLVMKYLSDKRKSWIKYLLFPGLIIRKIKKDSIGAMTEKDHDIKKLYEISNSTFNDK